MENIKALIVDLFRAKDNLKKLNFNANERWKFTLDGNLIGDIGEIIACYHYDLQPLAKGEKTHDARTKDGKYVQIKATQKDQVGLGLEKRNFEYLIVIRIFEDGKYELVYNGPGNKIWENTNSLTISVKKLKALNANILKNESIQIIREFT